MKFLWLLLLAVLAWRLFFGRWPWEPGRAAARSKALTQARTLLGVRESATREDIVEAHRRLISMVHPDRGGTSDLVHEANAARDVLLGRLATRDTERK